MLLVELHAAVGQVADAAEPTRRAGHRNADRDGTDEVGQATGLLPVDVSDRVEPVSAGTSGICVMPLPGIVIRDDLSPLWCPERSSVPWVRCRGAPRVGDRSRGRANATCHYGNRIHPRRPLEHRNDRPPYAPLRGSLRFHPDGNETAGRDASDDAGPPSVERVVRSSSVFAAQRLPGSSTRVPHRATIDPRLHPRGRRSVPLTYSCGSGVAERGLTSDYRTAPDPATTKRIARPTAR